MAPSSWRFINNKIVQSTSPRLVYDEQLHPPARTDLVHVLVLPFSSAFFISKQLKLSMRLKSISKEDFLCVYMASCIVTVVAK